VTGFVLMPQVGLRNAFWRAGVGAGGRGVRGCRRGNAGFRLFAGAVAMCALTGALFAFGGEGWKDVHEFGDFQGSGDRV